MDILEAIRPRKLADFVGNKMNIQKIQTAFTSQPSCILAISGPEGCGKTTLSQLLFAKLDMDVLRISKDNYNSKEALGLMQTFCANRTIDSYFSKKRKVIFIDDIDVLIAIDRSALTNIQSVFPLLKPAKVSMLICCNSTEERKVAELVVTQASVKKRGAVAAVPAAKIDIIKLTYPAAKDAYVYLLQQSIDYGIDEETLLKRVQYYRGNIREVIMNLQSGNAHEFHKNIYRDMNSFEVVQRLFHQGCEEADLRHLMQEDVGVIAFLLYENLPDEIQINRPGPSWMTRYHAVQNAFIETCKLENMVYDFGIWNFYDVIHLVRILVILATLRALPPKKQPEWPAFRYSQLLSKVSHHNIMGKRVKQHQDMSKWTQDTMFLMADAQMRGKAPPDKGSTWSNFANTYEKYFVAYK